MYAQSPKRAAAAANFITRSKRKRNDHTNISSNGTRISLPRKRDICFERRLGVTLVAVEKVTLHGVVASNMAVSHCEIADGSPQSHI